MAAPYPGRTTPTSGGGVGDDLARERESAQRVLDVVAEPEPEALLQAEHLAGHEQHAALGADAFGEFGALARQADLRVGDRARVGAVPREDVGVSLQPRFQFR